MSEIANIIFKGTKYTVKDATARAKADTNKKEIDDLKGKTLELTYQAETESLSFS